MSRILQATARVEYVSSACRAALLELAGSPRRWTSRTLVAWFVGPHALATLAAGRPPLQGRDVPELALAPDPLAASVAQARRALVDMLVGTDGRGARARMAIGCIRDGLVVRLRDCEGREGWTPERVPGVPLVDHLRALAAADCLMRPQDYELRLAYCGGCDRVSFGLTMCCEARGVSTRHPTHRSPDRLDRIESGGLRP
jgi:hypothetical protein